jgi:hypothetical protein
MSALQMSISGTGDCADQCAAALLEAKRANPGGLRRDDIAKVCRPIIEAHVAEEVARASPKGKRIAARLRTTIPPEPEWVTAYSAEIGWPMDGQKWCDNYAAKGWIVSGKAKMKDWQAAARNWKSNGWGADSKIYLGPPKAKPIDYRYTPEPRGDWRMTARFILNVKELPAPWTDWAHVPPDYRAQIVKSHHP